MKLNRTFFATAAAAAAMLISMSAFAQTESTVNSVRQAEDAVKSAQKDLRQQSRNSKDVISSKTYNTVGDIDTVAVGAVLLANDDVSEDDVYKVISGIYENMDAITKAHSKGAELNLITASSIKSVPYHKGAAKYYSEKGITVPTK